jgi:hypothetical protein
LLSAPGACERHLDLLRWGLLPYLTKDPVHARRPINARAETVATSDMFRRAFEQRRASLSATMESTPIRASGETPVRRMSCKRQSATPVVRSSAAFAKGEQ